ncbi:MAG: T9SS type A sorting domain-containing protein, partial [Bacteroidales bacterium]|nr:T9SS type A sorting domain-containing protein [Bacteroidales bacterium]
YIPQDGKNYAVINATGTDEIPVNFKAENNGTYTFQVNIENNTLVYLHLIDHMTGADIDLLANPSYTFTAKTTDYASRFKLVFSTQPNGDETDNDPFAFFSNGNIVINGEGTLQIIDALGRIVMSEQLSTLHATLSTLNFTPGIYLLQLTSGEKVRTQKIIII